MKLAALLFLTAAPFADLGAVDAAVVQFTGAAVGAEGGAMLPMDRRLRLQACGSPLALSWRNARRETVLVECPDAGGWRLFVPVRSNMASPVALPAISRGDSVTIAVSGAGFAVSQPGEAMEGGQIGAWIRVRSLNNKAQPMRARVVRPGMVAMGVD